MIDDIAERGVRMEHEMELVQLLNAQLKCRPQMQAQDFYKLLYQREFGCGHLAPALETAVAYLREEAAQAAGLKGAGQLAECANNDSGLKSACQIVKRMNSDTGSEHTCRFAEIADSDAGPGNTCRLAEIADCDTRPGTVEPLGNGLCRVYLDGAWDKETLRLFARIFCASARTHTGDNARFAAALRLLIRWADGMLPGTELSALRQMLSTADADANGFSAVHHSEAYRAAYAPHYRVVRQCYIDAWPALLTAQRTMEQAASAAPALLAIDGRCGSGKSTLAAHIAEVFECPVFHLDDFFLPPALRTEERLSQPGENVHHERFLEEILQPFLAGHTVRFCPFDCSVGALGDTVEVSPAPFAVAEGSYALHPALRGAYAASVFVTCTPEVQRARIAARSGEAALRVFEAKWIPLEEAYFAAYDIPAFADHILDTSHASEQRGEPEKHLPESDIKNKTDP